jgi:hypothetical protein
MEVASAVMKELSEKRLPIPRRRWNRFLVDHVPLMFIALVASVGIYRMGTMAMQQLDGLIQPTQEMTLNALEVLYEDMEVLYDNLQDLRLDAQEIKGFMANIDQTLEEEVVEEFIEEAQGPSFGMKDFESVFGITPINTVEFDPAVKHLFEDYDVSKDPGYLESPEDYDQITADYAPFIERDLSNDQRFTVKWNPLRENYGLYANVNLQENSFLGVFAGVVTDHSFDPSTTWRYKAVVRGRHGRPSHLVIDGHRRGNWFNFVQIEGDGNVEAFFLPYKNVWHIGFRTLKSVRAGEELLLGEADMQ